MPRIILILTAILLVASACNPAGNTPTASALPAAQQPAVTPRPTEPSAPAPGSTAVSATQPPAAATMPAETAAAGIQAAIKTPAPRTGALIIDHTTTDIFKIPTEWLETARKNIIWIYGSTSHGTQIWTGAEFVSNMNPTVMAFSREWQALPAQTNPPALRMGYTSDWGWDESSFLSVARGGLSAYPEATVFSWSWCGQMSDPNMSHPQTVNTYLKAMQQLESEYPKVTFVYMTGHTDQDNAALLDRNNNIIRKFVKDNNKVLFDFADIESYLPDGTPAPVPDDSCPWCESWCSTHMEICQYLTYMGDCQHTHPFNCVLKGEAFWWLSARLAGWDGES